MPNPRSVYSSLLELRRADIATRQQRLRRLGYGRLACVGAAILAVWKALASQSISLAWVALPIFVFVALMVVHERHERRTARLRRAERYFVRGLARLDNTWTGTGESGERYIDAAHPYALDLDLFGKGSLFELLCTARTHIGEDTLARWLLHPAPPAIAVTRQQAIEELRPRMDLREDLAVVAEEARTGVDPVSLARWGEAPPLLGGNLGWLLWVLTAFGLLGFAGLILMIGQSGGLLTLPARWAAIPRDVFLLVAVVNSIFLYRFRNSIGSVVGAVEEAAHELGLLSETLLRLEREQFRSPLLASLRASLDAEGEPPSLRLARLRRIVEYLDSRDNVFVRLLEVFVLWTPHLAVRVEDWRRHSGSAVRRWLTATGEMEALCSLSCYAYEHPADTFGEFATSGPLLDAEAIGHPLIPEDRVVRNDIRLGKLPQVLVVSGSNMSGKSTMLRTLGINAVLAQAGAPVRAARLLLSPLAVGASIRVSDSLQGGVSRFYAEILRLRQILDLTTGPLPVFFLIDEFLHGTNSHDRRIGAQALVRGLVERGAAGLITTHDLALAEIADTLGGRAANVHFEDHVEDGQILFDYHMRPGVVQKSNAIELMRSVGLEI
jgi:MutS domain V